MPANHQPPPLLLDFFDFWKKTKKPFAGLNKVKSSDAAIRPLLSKKVTANFQAFAEHDTASLVACWMYEGIESPEKAPVVWLDSEGSPNGVFANTVEEFLLLLPYGTGLIYEFLYCWEDYLRDPEDTPHPREELNTERIEAFLIETKEEYSGWENLTDWLEKKGLDWQAIQPYQVMENAFKAHPNLDQWLEKYL